MTAGLLATDPVTLGPYRLLARLGGGGMGQVFLATSPSGQLVAVKVIRPEFAADPEFRARFTREVANARNVSGRFTAAPLDADTEGLFPWLATAYIPGPPLSAAVREHGPLPMPSLLPLGAGLAKALAAIHAAGIVHRDLKPSNVLLATDGPRVIDFGISHAVEATTLTQTGAVMGSPGYMSPEQAQGRPVGPASDVFSLGAVLAFAATGGGRSVTARWPRSSTGWSTRHPTWSGCHRNCAHWSRVAWPRNLASARTRLRWWRNSPVSRSCRPGCRRRSPTRCLATKGPPASRRSPR
jgi:serine/threonine protein kinase